MPRARNIKHSFFTNDELAEIDPLGRLLFVGFWTIADFKGDLEWRPKKVKAELLPYDNCDIEALAINLDKSGFIRFYSDGEHTYIRVVNFVTHQNPHKNEKARGSLVPAYTESMRQLVDIKGVTINLDKIAINPDEDGTSPADSLSLIPDLLNDDSSGKSVPEKQKTKKTLIPKDFKISEEVKTWAEKNNHQNLEQHLENFVLTCESKPYKYTNWDSAFKRAIRDNWAKISTAAAPVKEWHETQSGILEKAEELEMVQEEGEPIGLLKQRIARKLGVEV